MRSILKQYKFDNKKGSIILKNVISEETKFKLYITDKLNITKISVVFPFYKRDLFKEAFYYIIIIDILDDKYKNILPEPILIKGIPLTKIIRTPLMFKLEIKYLKNILWFEKYGLNSIITPIEKNYIISLKSFFADREGIKIGTITNTIEIEIDNTINNDIDTSKYNII